MLFPPGKGPHLVLPDVLGRLGNVSFNVPLVRTVGDGAEFDVPRVDAEPVSAPLPALAPDRVVGAPERVARGYLLPLPLVDVSRDVLEIDRRPSVDKRPFP